MYHSTCCFLDLSVQLVVRHFFFFFVLQECLAAFDSNIANSLLACYKKTLSKLAAKKEDEDDTEADELEF